MGGFLLCPHSVLRFPSLSAFSRTRFSEPVLSIKGFSLISRISPIKEDIDISLFNLAEIPYRSLVSSVRADGNKGRPRKNPYPGRAPKNDGPDDNSQSFDGKSSSSANKEEILALFKRIQSSISKGDTVSPKKRTTEDKPSSLPSAETILGVLQQSRTQRKGKSVGVKGDKSLDTQKDSLKKEESAEDLSMKALSSTRPPSRFTRKSPIPIISSPREELLSETETPPATPTLPREETDETEEALNFAEMKLAQLKEVAKSKGIKGYSKLKKSELIELLIKAP